ncbi:MAG: hypothetical protein NVV82_19300 [Sporocytophaga sp.]|nr:hypothetical protein [Sporocytophaga sp.]
MRRFKFLALALCMMSLAACTEIFEKDIEDKEIIIYTPNDKESPNYTQTFWWSQIDFATGYELQVVYPNFSAPEKRILDTVVTTNRFPYYIGPGDFEWKVRAKNGAYKTGYYGSKFKIKATSLSEQFVNQKLPLNGSNVTGSPIILTWDKPLHAVRYEVQVAMEPGFNSPKEYQVVGQSYSLPVTEDNNYYWRVKAYAYNDTASTGWGNHFTFNVKNTPPKVSPLSPENGAIDLSASSITLSWNNVGSDYKYEVYTRVGTSGAFSLYKGDLLTTNTQFTGGSSGQTINWKVTSKNKNGVPGETDSDIWSFKIK